MDMKTKAVYDTARRKVEAVLNETNDPIIEFSLLSGLLAERAVQYCGGSWDKAIATIERTNQTTLAAVTNARKIFGEDALRKTNKKQSK